MSHSIASIPNDTFQMRKYLDKVPVDRLRYLYICMKRTSLNKARQRYKAQQIEWAINRRSENIITSHVQNVI